MNVNKLTVHCSDSETGDVDVIRQWHLARGWSDIGYHFVIKTDGTVQTGRPEDQEGAHVFGANQNNLGICLIGVNKFYGCQFDSLWHLVDALCNKYNISKDQAFGHYEFPSGKAQGKTCPNIFMPNLRIFLQNDITKKTGLKGVIKP